MAKSLGIDEYRALVGSEVGVSDWILVDQAKIDAFAEVTGDHQFIHVNPELAAQTPFGTTIAHGYLTLSLCSVMAYGVMPGLTGTKMGVNYGLNKVRFMAPVKSGRQVRGRPAWSAQSGQQSLFFAKVTRPGRTLQVSPLRCSAA